MDAPKKPPKKNNNFDFIEASAHGYRLLWARRHLVWRMMLPVFVVKLLSFTLILLTGMEENFTRQGLILLPSYFLEGWMLCRLVRLEFNSEASQNDLYAGTAIYALAFTLTSMLQGVILSDRAAIEAFLAPEEPNLGILVALFMMLGFSIWAVRLGWLYIPAVMGQGILDFLRRINGWIISFTLISTWFLCFLPIMVVMVLVEQLLIGIFPLVDGQPTEALQYAGLVFQSAASTLVAVLVTFAVGTGFRAIITGKPLKRT